MKLEERAEGYVKVIKEIANETKARIDKAVDLVGQAYIEQYKDCENEGKAAVIFMQEWHYVKDGVFPPDNTEVLIYSVEYGLRHRISQRISSGNIAKWWIEECFFLHDEQVIAWCELPPDPTEK